MATNEERGFVMRGENVTAKRLVVGPNPWKAVPELGAGLISAVDL